MNYTKLKIYTSIFLLQVVFCGNLYSQDFRKSNWGSSLAEVKKSENLEILDESEDVLAYKTELAGYDALIGYIFTGDKLTRAKYVIQEDHTNKSDHINDYNSLKKILETKYGKPYEDEIFWKNDLYKDDYSQRGFAVSLGHLLYFASWKTEKTEIVIVLNGENYEITNGIEYISLEYKDYENKTEEEKNLNDF